MKRRLVDLIGAVVWFLITVFVMAGLIIFAKTTVELLEFTIALVISSMISIKFWEKIKEDAKSEIERLKSMHITDIKE